jgi:hypothetical protein
MEDGRQLLYVLESILNCLTDVTNFVFSAVNNLQLYQPISRLPANVWQRHRSDNRHSRKTNCVLLTPINTENTWERTMTWVSGMKDSIQLAFIFWRNQTFQSVVRHLVSICCCGYCWQPDWAVTLCRPGRVPAFERSTLLPFAMIRQPQNSSAQRPFETSGSTHHRHCSTSQHTWTLRNADRSRTVRSANAQNRSSSVCVCTSYSFSEHSCVSVQWQCTRCSHVSVMCHVQSTYGKVQCVSVCSIRAHSRKTLSPLYTKLGALL